MKMKRVLSLLLALVMTFSLLTLPSYAEDEKAATLTVTMDGKAVDAVTLPQGGKVELKAQADAQVSDYCWQINIGGDTWVDIYGENAAACLLTFAKVRNVLDAKGKTQVRCIAQIDDMSVVTDAVTVSVADEAPAPARKMMAKAAAPVKAPLLSETPALEEECTVTVNYIFSKNGLPAADPWAATVTKGSNLEQTIVNPTVVGYKATMDTLPEGVIFTGESVALNLTDISSDISITVTYQPDKVNYTVKYYQQNVEDDNYTLTETKTYQAMTDSKLNPEDIEKTYKGFYQLPYDKEVTIAADGSTEIEIYYDRDYYLMTFDMAGGYGVEPIYARYGTPITVGTPTKVDYTFTVWNPAVPATMPAENTSYKANWTVNGPVDVTVVFWGENANDKNYSYYKALSISAMPDTELTFEAVQGMTICGQEEHTHDASCLSCTHKHDLNCYNHGNQYTNNTLINFFNKYLNVESGYVYSFKCGGTAHSRDYDGYYLFYNGKWYKTDAKYAGKEVQSYTGKDKDTNIGSHLLSSNNDTIKKYEVIDACKHTCTDACYTCGKTAHTHSSACYLNTDVMDPKLWTKVKSDTVTVKADGSTIMNVYYDRVGYTLKFVQRSNTSKVYKQFNNVKWGEDTTPYWNQAGDYKWYVNTNGSTFYTNAPAMPASNLTIYGANSSGSSTVHYYEKGTTNSIWPDVKVNDDDWSFTEEDYIAIEGFTYDSSNTKGSNYNIYYTRNSYSLDYFNYDGFVSGKSKTVPYQTTLTKDKYCFVPPYPEGLELGAFEFGGWYTTPGCYPGTEVKWGATTMPAANTIVYAKWVPVTHTVRFYLDETALASDTKLYDDQTVAHGSKTAPVLNPTNGDYKFVCWFYKDGDTEKAFDFANMPVTRDMQVYGKWSSTVLKQYFIYYAVKNADGSYTYIADPTTGSALAGNTKTFDAKGGSDLYPDYREGYFPVVTSHSLTLDIENDANNVYVFEYVQKEAVPYTVKYLEAGTNNVLKVEKVVNDNRKAVVTEKFEVINGYMPDAYQKSLVVSGADGADNTLIFYYTADTQHAYYKATHYLQNLDGETYTEYKTKQAKGDIGTTYSEEALTIPGYTFNADKSKADESTVSGKLTADGLELNLYYDRNSYPYQVNYLEQGTNKVLAEATNGTDLYGKLISANAKNISGYTCVSEASKTCTIAIEDGETAMKNVINFYYTENQATINYVVKGPEGCGSVTSTSETVNVVTGTATGSTATASSDNYKFVGWYSDPECQNPVPTAQVAGNKFTPAKDAASGLYVPATYYAKFEWNVADLTITKKGCDTTKDANQSFIFHVTGNGVDMYVTVQGNDSVTVKGLKVGSYKVEEVSSWSWRYTPDGGAEKNVSVNGGQTNEVTFTNTRNNNKWLSGDSYAINNAAGKTIH